MFRGMLTERNLEDDAMHWENLEKAKMLLAQTNSTCVFYNGQIILTDNRRGVRPLLDLLEGDADIAGFSAADKVVGKAAAFLYCLLKVHCLYASVISQPALDVLEKAGIHTQYGQLVPAIRNRTGDGYCPIESAVWDIEDAGQAYIAIQETLKKLQ